MRILLSCLLIAGLLSCTPETNADGAAQEGTAATEASAVANGKQQPASGPASKPEEKQEVYKPAFPALELKTWVLSDLEYDGRTYEPENDQRLTMVIRKNQVSGNSGCNDYSGSIALKEDGTFSVSGLASTKKLCQRRMTFEMRFQELLKNAESFSVNQAFLEVNCSNGKLSFSAPN
ncbi:META domain-containing protein [Phaeodactylibacter luteus]|nr:META domain-containing protein [Phaeodactylibacter luteus]